MGAKKLKKMDSTNTTAPTQTPVDINALTPAEKKALMKQLADQEKAEKNKLKADKVAYKDLSNEFVLKHIDGLVERQQGMEILVQGIFKDYSKILDLKSDIFGEDVRDQESHTITHPDGSCSITIGYNINISFDGTESAGISKIKNYLLSLTSDDEIAVKLHKMVNVLLRPNKKTGMLNPASIIQLNQMRDDVASLEFDEGLDIIIAAQSRAKSSMYVGGWKFIELADKRTTKLEFRFTI